MPLIIETAIASPLWKDIDFDIASLSNQVARLTWDKTDKPKPIKNRKTEVSLLLTDNKAVQDLNRDYRGKDKPTNVLSFAALESEDIDLTLYDEEFEIPIGDIIVAYETLEQEARDKAISIKDHFVHLLIHGILHLFLYDHENDEDAEKMEKTEIEILGELGIKNPYLNE